MITGFIIAKNEEHQIERALKSLKFCDEIIFVDTGSNDNTKKIAQQYTKHVYHFEWIDDFSAVRNFAISKCTQPWIVYVDADDEIDESNQRQITNSIKNAAQDTPVILVNYEYGKGKTILTPRIFRNNGLKFIHPVHEELDLTKEHQKHLLIAPEIKIIHHKLATENEETLQRNIQILKKHLEKSQTKSSHKNETLQLLAREYFSLKKYDLAKKYIEQINVIDIQDNSTKYQTLLLKAKIYEKNGALFQAEQTYRQAFEADSRFNEPLIKMADMQLYLQKNPQAALQNYELALRIEKPLTSFPLNPGHYHNYPQQQIKKIEKLKYPIALICGYYGMQNIGDELMCKAIIENLPKYRPVIASYNPTFTQAVHNVESVKYKEASFDQALKISQLVIIGGGTLFHDQGLSQNQNVIFYTDIISKAHSQEKRIVIMGVGVDKINLSENQQLMRQYLPLCQYIFVRDKKSKQNLNEIGIDLPQIKVISDLSFALQFGNNPHSHQDKLKKIGINLCASEINSSHDVQKKVDQHLIPFIKKTKAQFVFIPAHPKDTDFHKYLQDESGKQIEMANISPVTFFDDYSNALNDLDFLIASRYHMIILGIVHKIPTTVVSYSEKTESLKGQFELIEFEGGMELSNLSNNINIQDLHKETIEALSQI